MRLTERLFNRLFHLSDALARRTAARRFRLEARSVGADAEIGRHILVYGGRNPANRGLVFGDRCTIYDYCKFMIDPAAPQSGIRVGDRVSLNYGAYIDGSGGVEIGDDTLLAPNVVIISSSHNYHDLETPIALSGKTFTPVCIGKNVWIGSHVTILAGAVIGDGAIIGAGAVVRGHIPPNTVAGGVPARILKIRGS